MDYQCRIITRAIKNFLETYQQIQRDREAFERWLWDSGLYGKLNDKQRMVFNIAKDNPQTLFTARNVEQKLNCSYNTAATLLNGLVELNLFTKRKDGREWVYTLQDKTNLQKSWRS